MKTRLERLGTEKVIKRLETGEFELSWNDRIIDRCTDAPIGVVVNKNGVYEINTNGWIGSTGYRTSLKKEYEFLLEKQERGEEVKIY